MPRSTMIFDGDHDTSLTIEPDGSANVTIVNPLELNGAMPVNVQDQTTPMINLRFIKAKGNQTTLKTTSIADTYTVDLNDTTGFVDGNIVGIFDATDGSYYFAAQKGAPVGDTITFDTPLDYTFDAGSNVINATSALNVDGSVTRQIFQIGPIGGGTGLEVDITKMTGIITDNSDMDDSKFGGIAALTNGCVLRKNNGTYVNYGNVKRNKDIALYAGKANEYTDKAGGGEYSMTFEFEFGGQENQGVVIRLEPGNILEILIQDDLTDLTSFEMMAKGHVVTD